MTIGVVNSQALNDLFEVFPAFKSRAVKLSSIVEDIMVCQSD
jgi:hypothetical protein